MFFFIWSQSNHSLISTYANSIYYITQVVLYFSILNNNFAQNIYNNNSPYIFSQYGVLLTYQKSITLMYKIIKVENIYFLIFRNTSKSGITVAIIVTVQQQLQFHKQLYCTSHNIIQEIIIASFRQMLLQKLPQPQIHHLRQHLHLHQLVHLRWHKQACDVSQQELVCVLPYKFSKPPVCALLLYLSSQQLLFYRLFLLQPNRI
eukprot:TRINITY_DN5498_c0_g1_i1.p1 TRINITY_DN5498_c0_g1~~TRINITY_DN5498_c0_g1_i1.p1  ORF type:complete len:204 (+),score=-17.54 TRINITY_DN5498_c0_g1_i1:101-712(+)